MWRVSGKYCQKCGPLTPHGWHGNSRGRDSGILGLPLWGDGLYLSVELNALQEKKTTSSWAAVMAINAPSVDVWTRASNLFAIEVGVSPERASGAGEGEHGQGDGDGHVHADLHTWIIFFSHFCLYKSAHSHPYSSKTSEQSSSRRWHHYEEVDDDCLMVTGKRKKKTIHILIGSRLRLCNFLCHQAWNQPGKWRPSPRQHFPSIHCWPDEWRTFFHEKLNQCQQELGKHNKECVLNWCW